MAQGKLCAANPVHGRGPTVTRLVKNTRAEAVEVLQYVLETYKGSDPHPADKVNRYSPYELSNTFSTLGALAPNSLSLPQNPEIILNQEQSRKMSRIRTWHRKAFSLNREELRGLSIPEYQEDRTRFKLIV
ncbi:hypothetical protein ACO22_01369 [Paracoccidioides brasiliensis]|uniref:Uncharacterized protein n=1 Tax=Paracoccidioides brasiliensis TaxID=121759 RepID=A0A1D2JLR6_PARBR|nr:hypothetical protein ACO22_01369 [Paracoccidioides brasiliensis]